MIEHTCCPGYDGQFPAVGKRFCFATVHCSSVTKSCPTLCDPMNCSMPGFPSSTLTLSLHKLMSIDLVKPSNHLILCHPLLLLPSIFPNIRVFSNESALRIRWPRYWSFSFSISPPNEYSELISFRMGWFHPLAVKELSTVFSSTIVRNHFQLFNSFLLVFNSIFLNNGYMAFPWICQIYALLFSFFSE